MNLFNRTAHPAVQSELGLRARKKVGPKTRERHFMKPKSSILQPWPQHRRRTRRRALTVCDTTFWASFDDEGNVKTYKGDELPLPEGRFSHPRATGTSAKVLRSYVRERALHSLNEAVRKISLMPAQKLEGFVPQMRKKDCQQVGMNADIVVLDPATIADKATHEDANQRLDAARRRRILCALALPLAGLQRQHSHRHGTGRGGRSRGRDCVS